jgi:hypothetical protein
MKMDQEKTPLCIFPASQYLNIFRVNQQQGKITIMHPQEVSKAIGVLSPQCIRAFQIDITMGQEIKRLAYMINFMPMPVVRSPLLTLITFNVKEPWNEYYDTSLNVILELEMYGNFCKNIYRNEEADEFYNEQIRLLDDYFLELLNPLLTKYRLAQTQDQKFAFLVEFCTLLQRRTINEIHLLEQMIHSHVFQDKIPLEAILTPVCTPEIQCLSVKARDVFIKEMEIFFQTHTIQTNALLMRAGVDPIQSFTPNVVSIQQAPLIGQYMPAQTMEEYLRYLDYDGQLK